MFSTQDSTLSDSVQEEIFEHDTDSKRDISAHTVDYTTWKSVQKIEKNDVDWVF